MKPFNVEIFDRAFNFKENTEIDPFDFAYDYLSPENNTVELRDVTPEIDDYIKLTNDEVVYFGIVSEMDKKKNGITSVTFKDAMSLFDVTIVIDKDEMTGTLEDYIAARISELYISNTDTAMNIGATVRTETSTNDWQLDIETMEEDTTLCEVNLFDDIILPAFKAYEVIIKSAFNLGTKKIDFVITKNTAADVTIEADLPAVIEKQITVRKSRAQTNKLTVYNKDDWSAAPIVYYLHPDGTFSTEDTDRITPVKWDYSVITSGESAEEEAERVFAEEKYNNLITLTIVKPPAIEIGQHVNVISDGTIYKTILTGREENKTVKLIFGNIRMSIIKIMKGRA